MASTQLTSSFLLYRHDSPLLGQNYTQAYILAFVAHMKSGETNFAQGKRMKIGLSWEALEWGWVHHASVDRCRETFWLVPLSIQGKVKL